MLNTLAMANLLKGEYKEVFTKIDLYGSMGNVDVTIYEDRIMNLYDIFVEAQEEGKPVEKIVGKDIEEFCKEYFKSEEQNHGIKNFLGKLANIMTVIFIYSIVDYMILAEDNIPFMERTVNLIPVVVGLCAGFLLVIFGNFINKKVTFKKEKLHPTLYYFAVLLIFIVGIVAGVTLLDDVLVGLPLYIVLIVSGSISIVFNGVALFINYKKKGTFHKVDKEDKRIKKEFEDEISFRGGLVDVASGMAFRYKRRKKKYARKGKEFTQEDYAKTVRKEIASEKKFNIMLGIFVSVMIIIPVVHEIVTVGLFDAAILFVVLVIIEVLIFRWSVKFLKEQYRSYALILDACEEKGIDIVEYYEQMK